MSNRTPNSSRVMVSRGGRSDMRSSSHETTLARSQDDSMAGQSRNPTPLSPPPHRAVRGRARWAGRIFVQGLAAVVPVSITLYILWWIGSGFEALLGGMLQSILPE